MAFDIEGARAAGYSDGEIADFLGKDSGFDVAGAQKAGYEPAEIVAHLSSLKKPAAPAAATGRATDAEIDSTLNTPINSDVVNEAAPAKPGGVAAELANLRDSFFTGVDNTRASVKTVNMGMVANRLQKTTQRLKDLEARGEGESTTARQMRSEIASAKSQLPRAVGEMTEAQGDAQRGAAISTRPAVTKVGAAKTFGEAWEAFKEAPYDVIAGVTATSLPSTLPALVAAAVMGPGAGALAMGANSAAVEGGSALAEFARDAGVDVTNAKAVEGFFTNPQNLAAAMSYAGKRAGVIGALDAASGGLAGKTIAPAMKSQIARQAVNLPTQMGAQAALGAGGEAGAQLVTKGEIDQPGQVLMEAAGELGGAPMEVAAFGREARLAAREKSYADKYPSEPGTLPGVPPAPVDPVAAIGKAQTVDEAIAVAQAAVQSSTAVDNIAQILEQNLPPAQSTPAPAAIENVAGLTPDVAQTTQATTELEAANASQTPASPLAEAAALPALDPVPAGAAAGNAAPAGTGALLEAVPAEPGAGALTESPNVQNQTPAGPAAQGQAAPAQTPEAGAAAGSPPAAAGPATGDAAVQAAGVEQGPGGVSEPVSVKLQTKAGEIEARRAFRGKYEFMKDGEKIGVIQYTNTPMGGYRVTGVTIDPAMRRQGVATTAYDFLERITGKPLESGGGGQSADGAAFREARKAAAKAEAVTGEQLDKQWTAFAPDSGTLSVPRAEMPQIKAEHRGAMVNFLNARDIAHTQEEVPPTSLKPTQAEFSPAKVEKALGFTGPDRSILVSSDNHVLDGHHQWMSKLQAGEPVKIIRLDAPIKQLLETVKEFPSAEQARGATATQQRADFAASEKTRKVPGTAARTRAHAENPFKAFLGKHGISNSLAAEFAPGLKERQAAMVQGYGPMFRKSGPLLDALAARAVEEGFLLTPDEAKLQALITDALRGKRIIPQYAQGVAEDEGMARAARAADLEQQDAEAQNAEVEAENQAERDAIQAVADLPDTALEFLSDADIVLTASNNVSEADFLRALGATEQEIEDATAKQSEGARQGDQGRAGAEETAASATPGNPQGRDGQAGGGEGLTSPTPADVLAQQQRAADGAKAEAKAATESENKAKADAERGEFALTGSDRAADVGAAGGQGSMFAPTAEYGYTDANGRFNDSTQPDDGREPAAAGSAADDGLRGAGGSLQRRARITGLGIAADIERAGSAALVGREVRSADDLAELAQIYRDPRYETFRVFFTKGNTVVHATGVSARLPGQAPMMPAGMKSAEYFSIFRDDMARTGADGYYILHNHPSGNPTPSDSDVALTEMLAGEVPGMAAHVVINSNKYAVITAGADVTVASKTQIVTKDFGEDKLLQASKPMAALDRKIGSTDDLALVGKSMQKPGWITLIGVDSGGKVRMVAEAPSQTLMRSPEYLAGTVRRLQRQSGAASMFAVGDSADINSAPIKQAVREGILRDALPDVGMSLASTMGANQNTPFNKTKGRYLAEEAAEYTPAERATNILDAAAITGKDRLEALRDVRAGLITPEELEAAYPARGTNEAVTNPKDVVGKSQANPADDSTKGANSLQYPLAPAGTRYEETSLPITQMKPDEFLKRARPLEIDESSRENIDELKGYMRAGKGLDPLHLYANGKEDGRHRAHAAKELGISTVPVIDHTQGGRSADDSTPGDHSKRLTPETMRAGESFVSQIEALAEEHGTVYIRWSPGSERDLTGEQTSRDFVSGSTHAGLSAIEVTSDTHPIDIAKSVTEYGFARMQDADSRPHVYLAKRVGTDSDSYASIKPTRLLLTADDQVLKAIDGRFDRVMDLRDDIQRDEARLKRIADPSAKAITERSIAENRSKLESLQPNEPTAPDSGGAGRSADARIQFSRAPALEPIQTKSGATAFKTPEIALANPRLNVRQPGGAVTRIDYEIRDRKLYAQAISEGATPADAREEASVGTITLDVDKAGVFKSLRNIEVFQSKRGNAIAEKVVGGIMESLPAGAKLNIHDILPTATGFWDKMGASFPRSEDSMEANLSPEQFRNAYDTRKSAAGTPGQRQESRTAEDAGRGQGRPGDDGAPAPRAGIRNPSTVERVQAAVAELVGGKQLPNKLGRVVATTASEIKSYWEPQIGQNVQLGSEGEAGQAQAFFDPRTKTVFLIADNIPAGDEMAVAAHELMHKHGVAVLGKDGWDKLHSVINSWANAPEDSDERAVYNYARSRVEAVGMELSSQEMFPYAVEAAIKMGVKPSLIAKQGTVARWLGSVKYAMQQAWGKVTGKPETFKTQDLVDLAFGIAQMENPESAAEMGDALAPRVWRSALADGIQGINAKAQPGEGWRAQITGLVSKGIVKADEVEWTGLTDWLKLQTGKVTKDQVLDYLDGNGVQVEETMLGGGQPDGAAERRAELQAMSLQDLRDEAEAVDVDPESGNRADLIDAIMAEQASDQEDDSSNRTKYEKYQLPGGQNYRELLLTLPQANPMIYPTPLEQLPSNFAPIYDSRAPAGQQWGIVTNEGSSARPLYGKWATAEEAKEKALGAINSERNIKAADEWRAKNTGYKSGHWDQRNILAHIRFNERTDADGKKVLLIEELQSDFGADYRKSKDAINNAVDNDFEGIIDRMTKAGVLQVECD